MKSLSGVVATAKEPELTMRGLALGVAITFLFTAANVYRGLKVGLTFATSMPAAVISMALLRAFKDAGILENNIVRTVASAAGTLAAIIFVLPEVVSHFVRAGMTIRDVKDMLNALQFTLVPADAGLVWEAERLRADTTEAGLSLGDRSSLALANAMGYLHGPQGRSGRLSRALQT